MLNHMQNPLRMIEVNNTDSGRTERCKTKNGKCKKKWRQAREEQEEEEEEKKEEEEGE